MDINKKRFTISIAKKLLYMLEGRTLPSSSLPRWIVDELRIEGLNMMPSKLYQVDGNNHFMTKRFDRNHGKKIHTQTLAAISPDADSYEQLITEDSYTNFGRN